MLIGAVQLRMMAEGVVHVHGASARHGKHIPHAPFRYIIRYII